MYRTYTDTDETTGESGNSQLFFDPEDVTNRTGEYSALSDIYGWPVFTEEFEEKERIYKEQVQSRRDILLTNIIISEDLSNEFDDVFAKVMTSEDSYIVKNDFNQQEASAGLTMTGVVLMSILMVCFCFFMLMNIRRKADMERKKDEDSFNDYNIEDESLL